MDAVIDSVIERRFLGQRVPDDAVRAEFPHLMPELDRALHQLHIVERAKSRAAELARAEAAFEASHSPRLLVAGYDVLRPISEGGQAAVYLARHVPTGRMAALKVLRADESADGPRLERFEREIRILASLKHPGIVSVLEHGTTLKGQPYFAMDYVEGQDLDPGQFCASASPEERLRIFLLICDAVGAAHDHGVVHRDLKPTNIRLDSTGTPHILDFGLALTVRGDEVRRSMTVTGQFLGTFLWSSPEQVDGTAEATPASDVYSLGIILHQMFANGRHPLQAFVNLQQATGLRRGQVSKKPDLEDDLEIRPLATVIARCLSPNPVDRPQNARELGRELQRVPMRPAKRRGKAIALAAVVVGLAITAFGSGHLWWQKSIERNRGMLVNGRARWTTSSPEQSFVWIPPGEFMMGSPADEPGRVADEVRHRVVIPKGFYLAENEVSQRHFKQLMGYNPSRFVDDDDNPVERVNWFEATEYCKRLSRLIGRVARLPTEAEWEYACRAGSDAPFVTGQRADALHRYANLGDLSCPEPLQGRTKYDDGAPYTWNVRTGLANPWRLQNMEGNVWEWCADVYAPYPSAPIVATAPATQPTRGAHVLMNSRGGSWYDDETSARAASRNPLDADTRASTLGFRVLIEDSANRP